MNKKNILKLAGAIHQAGHAVAYVQAGIKFRFVTLDEHKGEGAVKHLSTPEGVPLRSDLLSPQRFYENFIRDVINCSGLNAELEFIPDGIDPPGLREANPHHNHAEANDEFVSIYSQFTAEFSYHLIMDSWREIEIIAGALVKRGTLSYEEITNLIKSERVFPPQPG